MDDLLSHPDVLKRQDNRAGQVSILEMSLTALMTTAFFCDPEIPWTSSPTSTSLDPTSKAKPATSVSRPLLPDVSQRWQ